MSQSLASLHIHLIFSTRGRRPWLRDSLKEALHAYQAKVLQNLGCQPVLINSAGDHVHLLFDLARTVPLSRVVEDVKKFSSKWIKSQGPELADFAWQAGYGAFAVSLSDVPTVREYIARQEEHHREKSFQNEYRDFLMRHKMPFDERYLWD